MRSMELLLSHQTALAFWRNSMSAGHAALGRRNHVPRCAPTLIPDFDAEPIRGAAFEGGPLHILLSSGNARSKKAAIASHVQTAPLPPGSICRIGHFGSIDLYVVSPELCFIQMLGTLDWVDHAMLGFELCGTYRTGIIAASASTTRYNMGRLASVDSLLRTASLMKGAAHSQQAARACRLILDNSASPAESVLALVLTAANSKGGYGLPKPQLNPEKRMIIPGRRPHANGGISQNRSRCVAFRPDLYWPDGNVALEYDSRQFHSDPESMTENAIRYNNLQDRDLTAFIATAGQLRSVHHSDLLAQQIGRALGVRTRIRCKDFRAKQLHLRRKLGLA